MRLLLASLLAQLAFTGTLVAEPVYAAPDASMAALGTREDPTSLAGAIARAAKENSISEIVLLDGRYTLDSPWRVTLQRPDDSPLIIKAATSGNAIISGGRQLSPPRRRDDGILAYPFRRPNDRARSRDLYFDGVRARRAASIAYYDWSPAFSAIPGLAREHPEDPSSDVRIAASFQLKDHSRTLPPFDEWERPEDVEFVFRCAWWEKRIGVSEATASRLRFAEPGWSLINQPWGNESRSRLNAPMPKMTLVEGALELLDSPGEWHHGPGEVLFYPIDAIPPETVTLAEQERLLVLEGCENLAFEGLAFQHTTWRLPIDSFGFNEGQANHEQTGRMARPPAAVSVANSTHVSLRSCSFSQLGAVGLSIDDSSHIEILDSRFMDIAATAIRVGGVAAEQALTGEGMARDIAVKRNWIHRPAQVYQGGVGIFVGYASNATISDNEVCHAPYTGISMGWGWNELDGLHVAMHGNRITGNLVHHHLQSMYDGGGIYTLGPQSNESRGMSGGLLIANNEIHHQSGLGNIIYSDGGSSWITIERNLTYNNLREIDQFYEGSSRYIADWGGCGPAGNLRFAENILGNAKNKFPNFRCAPSDPEPWDPAFRLPPQTTVSSNTFLTLPSHHNPETSRLSFERHRFDETPFNGIVGLALDAAPDAFLAFTLEKETALVASEDLLLHRSSAFASDSSLRLPRDRPVTLPVGYYRIEISSRAQATIATRLRLDALGPGRLAAIATDAPNLDFRLAGGLPAHYLALPIGPRATGKLELLNADDSTISESSNWLEHPYNWKTFRALLDRDIPLPARETPVLLTELPSQSYRVRARAEPSIVYLAPVRR